MKITNIQKGPRGVNTLAGTVLIEPGQTVEAELSAAEHKVAKATGWFDFEGKPRAEPKKAEGEQGGDAPGALIAKHSGGGRYFVVDGGEKVSDVMTKEDAEAFNALSDEEKAAFVKKD